MKDSERGADRQTAQKEDPASLIPVQILLHPREETGKQDKHKEKDMPSGTDPRLSRLRRCPCISSHDAAAGASDPALFYLQVIQLPVCSVQKSNGSNAHLQKPDRPHDNKH